MIYNKYCVIVHLLLFSFCLCEINVDQKEEFFNDFVNYYNSLPNQIPTSDESSLQSTQQMITSDEQLIEIPRDQPNVPCIGCASHVNPQAAGVSELANLGVRHLDIHEPSVKHSLDSVLDVERQVQVVNGVRYILTLSINFNNCSEAESENCATSKTCKITILVKPWVKLSNGAKYRAILANNCTEEWQYGDNGEFLPEVSPDNRIHNQNKGDTSEDHDGTNASDDEIQVKQNTEVQSQPDQERTLTDEEIKDLQEQIIPNIQISEITEAEQESVATSPVKMDNQNVFKVDSGKYNENSYTGYGKNMLDIFDFSGFKTKSEIEHAVPMIRRNYDYPWIQKVKCEVDKDLYRTKRQVSNFRLKRGTLIGGPLEKDPTDPKYKVLAEQSLRKHEQISGITQSSLNVIQVDKVTTQVVSGSLTKIDFAASDIKNNVMKCNSAVWERPWLDSKEITVTCKKY